MNTRESLAQYFANTENVPQDTKDALTDGKLEYDDVSFYFRVEATGDGGTEVYHDNTNEREYGITNLDRGKLQKFYNASLDKVRIAYATTTDTDALPSQLAYSPLAGGWPAALRNAELVIRQDGNEVQSFPIVFLGMQSDNDTNTHGYSLESAITLVEQKETSIEIRYPKNVSMPATDRHFVEITLTGSQTRPRVNK